MDMVSFIIGAAVGAGVVVAKDAMTGESNNSRQKTAKRQQDELYAENEKLRNRNRDAERRIEDLNRELQKAKARVKDKDDNVDDLEDELAGAKAKVKKLTLQNDELLRKVQEYQRACDSYEAEIQKLKRQ